MAWSLVADYLRRGSKFLVMEGPKPVAEAKVTEIFEEGQP